MKSKHQHPSNDELLDYKFDLAEGDAREQTEKHLADCEACRERMEWLAGKIRTLDLLKDEVDAPQDLLNSVRAMAADEPVSEDSATSAGVPVPPVDTVRAADNVPDSAAKMPTETAETPRQLQDQRSGKPAVLTAMKKFWFAVAAVIALGLGVMFLVDDPVQPPQVEYFGNDEPLPFEPASNIELNVLPTRDSVQLTIYNSADLTLVRERRKLTMKKGWNWLQFMWANTLIDPTSLELNPVGAPDKVDVVQLVFPPRLKGVGRWLVKSEVSGPVECEITYFTSGLHWRAFYMGTLTTDEKSMMLDAYVRVDNGSGEDYEEAQTRLIVGKVNLLDRIAQLAQRQYAYQTPGSERVFPESFEEPEMDDMLNEPLFGARAPEKSLIRKAPKTIKKQGLSEYFLYTIEGTETIPNGWGKRLPSFAKPRVPVTNLYKYDEDRWGAGVIRFLYFKNDKEHTLGETPIPNGTMRIYAEARTVPEVDDPQGPYLSYVGASSFKYIPVDEKVELNLGLSQKVKVEPKLMNSRTENFTFDRWGNINGWDEVQDWTIKLNNTRDIPAKIEITRNTRSNYWAMKHTGNGITYKKHDATHARFEVELPAQAKEVLTYELRRYHGKRREALK